MGEITTWPAGLELILSTPEVSWPISHNPASSVVNAHEAHMINYCHQDGVLCEEEGL